MTEEGRRAQILDAAFEEFSSRGVEGATIKGIAGRAGLRSPALIYWYFEDKEALFRSVLESRAPLLRVVLGYAASHDEPPEEFLPTLARAYFATARGPVGQRMARLMVGEATRRPEVAEMLGRATVARVLGSLGEYLSRQVELGRLRSHDTRSSSRAFIGMLVPQVAVGLLLPDSESGGLDDEEHIRNSVEIFLRGLGKEE